MVVLRNCEKSESDKAIEYSEELDCFYFPPSPTYFPPSPTTFPPSPPSYFPLYSQATPLRPSSSNSSDKYTWAALNLRYKPNQQHEDSLVFEFFVEYTIQDRGGALDVIPGGRLIRINEFEQQHEDIIHPTASDELDFLLLGSGYLGETGIVRSLTFGQEHSVDPVRESVDIQQYQIQCKCGALAMIPVWGALRSRGLEVSDDRQGLSTTPEPSCIFQNQVSIRVWEGHDGEWGVEFRFGWNWLNLGTFNSAMDPALEHESVIRLRGGKNPFDFPFPGLFLQNENRAEPTTARITEIPTLEVPPTAQQENPDEDFGLGCSEATGNDEVEVVGIGSERTGDCVVADQAQLDSGFLGKRKTMEKNPARERRSTKTNGVRIPISLDDILQTKGMRLKDAAEHLKVSQSTLKSACRKYGIHRWPPRKLISQSHSNEISVFVDQEGIPQLNYDNLPSDQALAASVDTNGDAVKEIPPPLFLPIARQENLDEDVGNDEVEAVGMGSEGAGESEMKEDQLDSKYLGKGKKKEMTKGEKSNKKNTGVRIAIPFEDILQTKEMRLKDAAEHLKVSRSTMKRVCRDYNIYRWPPREEPKIIGQSPPNKSPPVVFFDWQSPPIVDQERIPQLNSDKLLPPNKVSASTDTNNVSVKARYGKVTIKFQMSWPWEMVELEQQVKKRLKLEVETYYINYKDDNELILIACDEDLQDYISRSSLLGTSSIEVFLEPK